MFESLATMIGGLGLFFAGVWFLSENLKRAAGRRFRRAIIAWTRHSVQGFAWGAFFGAVTQSMQAIVFILVSMLTAGLIGVRTALPVVTGANIGSGLLVLVSTLDIAPPMYLLVGLTGIAVSRSLREPGQVVAGALFGLGMLFVGINLLQSSAALLVQRPWASDLLYWTHDSYAIGFLTGALLTILSHSSGVIAILALTLLKSGLLGIDQTIMTIYGANFGSAVLTLLLSAGLRGRSMQIAVSQATLNILGCLILVPLFFVELYGGVPLMKHLVESITDNVETQMAYVYLFFNLVGAAALLSIKPDSLLERYWPPISAEDDAQVRFIQDRAIGEPDTALDLAALEQRRLVERLPHYIEAVRSANGGRRNGVGALHGSFHLLAGQVAEYLTQIGRTNPSSVTYLRLNDFLNNQRIIESAETTLAELALTICDVAGHSPLGRIGARLTEALDAVLLTLNQVLQEGDELDRHFLQTITGDRSEVFQRLRDVNLSEHKDLGGDDKIRLLEITNLTERMLWLLRELKIDAITIATASAENA